MDILTTFYFTLHPSSSLTLPTYSIISLYINPTTAQTSFPFPIPVLPSMPGEVSKKRKIAVLGSRSVGTLFFGRVSLVSVHSRDL